MKKLIALLLALVMLFSLVGCALYSSDDIEAAREEGYEQGYDEGYAEGRAEGRQEATADHWCEYTEADISAARDQSYNEGYDDGYWHGEEDGYENGYENGYADGSSEGSYGSASPILREDTIVSSEMVYVSRTGSKYHSNQYCSNMSNPEYMTIEAAINLGRTACKNCY